MATEFAQTEEMTRDELEDEVQELRQKVELLDSIFDVKADPEDASLEDIWIAGEPIGMFIENLKSRQKTLKKATYGFDTYEEIESRENSLADDIESGSDGVSTEVREKLLPIHKMWIDVREGDENSLSANDRRAARLFGRFIRRAAGDSNEIDPTNGTYSLSSGYAKGILQQADDITKNGQSVTVRRVMEKVQRYSKEGECSCESVKKCTHGLVQFDNSEKTNYLVADKDGFNQAMSEVESMVKGDVN